MAKTGSELVKFDAAQYPALSKETRSRTMEVIAENTDGEGLTPRDLDRVKVPSGDALYFNLKTEAAPNGEPRAELRGVILHMKKTRVYYETSFEEGGGNDAPTCYCDDAVGPDGLGGVGVGTPGGPCAQCAFGRFTKDPVTGIESPPACAQKNLLLMVLKGDVLPRVVSIPPSGLKPLRDYTRTLNNANVRRSEVETVIGLESAKGGPTGKVAYAKPTFAIGERLTPEAVAAMEEYKAEMAGLLPQVKAD